MDGDVAFKLHVYKGREGAVHFIYGARFLSVVIVRGGEGCSGVYDCVFRGGEHVDEVVEEEI